MTVRTECVSGLVATGSPKNIPFTNDFEEGDDYLEADLIRTLASALIRNLPEFEHLHYYSASDRIGYFWKPEGKKKNGKLVLGEAKKASGLAKHLGRFDFVVEIAALEARRMTNLQLEALVYHTLCHLQVEETEDGERKPTIVGHDTEMFRAELENYGYWHPDLIPTGRVFKQIALPSEPANLSARRDRLDESDNATLMERLHDHAESVFQDAVDRDGSTVTITAGGKSTTVAPRKSRVASK